MRAQAQHEHGGWEHKLVQEEALVQEAADRMDVVQKEFEVI